jgi:hypothetical protein
MRREGISFFIVPPSCFASVYPLNFLQVYMLGKAIGWGACLVSPYFGNDLNLGLYPTLSKMRALWSLQAPNGIGTTFLILMWPLRGRFLW